MRGKDLRRGRVAIDDVLLRLDDLAVLAEGHVRHLQHFFRHGIAALPCVGSPGIEVARGPIA